MKKVGPPAVGLEDAAAADNFEKEHKLLVIGLFEDDAQRTAFETVARQLEDVFFAYSSSPSVAAKYGMTAPAVRMLYPFDEKAADYVGDIASVTDLETFVKAHRHPIVTTFTGETAAELFSDGRPILFLFRRKDDAGEKAERELQNAAITLNRKVLVSLAGDSEPMDQRLMDYITVEPEELPTVRLVANVTESMTKYKLPGNEITASALTAFVQDYFEPGKLMPHYKSEEPPASQTGPVITVVGSTFNSIVKDTSKDVLVEFYAPWCGHCKKLEPVFRDVAKKLESVSTLVIAKIDATANDVEGVDVEGFPTIKLWRADKKDDPVDFDGDRDVYSFINWLEEKVSIPFSQNEVKTEL
jgi:protein disulfide-isomerase A1